MKTSISLLISFTMLVSLTGTTFAQAKKAAEPAPYTKAIAEGNKAYNGSKYNKARAAYVRAIQLYPQGAPAYRNLARTHFWQNNYSAAIHFYDVYLVNYPKAPDRAQIQQERKLASTRAPAQPWSPPKIQQKALLDLEKALASGVGYARGSGAFHQYEALLRTEYAEPDLLKLKQRLSIKLLLEHDELLQTKPGQPTPQLDLEAWRLQTARLEAAKTVASSDLVRTINDRLLLGQAARTLLLKDYKKAAAEAASAAKANQDMVFMRWFLIVALYQSNDLSGATKALNTLEGVLKKQDPTQLPYLKVTRAMLLQKQGKIAEASTLYQQTLEKD